MEIGIAKLAVIAGGTDRQPDVNPVPAIWRRRIRTVRRAPVMSSSPRRVAGATLGCLVRGLSLAEAAAESLGGVLTLFQWPRYSVGVRRADGQHFRTELHGGTRSRVLDRAREMYPDCRVASLTRLRRRPDHRAVRRIEQ
jgi:hypothetical protein